MHARNCFRIDCPVATLFGFKPDIFGSGDLAHPFAHKQLSFERKKCFPALGMPPRSVVA